MKTVTAKSYDNLWKQLLAQKVDGNGRIFVAVIRAVCEIIKRLNLAVKNEEEKSDDFLLRTSDEKAENLTDFVVMTNLVHVTSVVLKVKGMDYYLLYGRMEHFRNEKSMISGIGDDSRLFNDFLSVCISKSIEFPSASGLYRLISFALDERRPEEELKHLGMHGSLTQTVFRLNHRNPWLFRLDGLLRGRRAEVSLFRGGNSVGGLESDLLDAG